MAAVTLWKSDPGEGICLGAIITSAWVPLGLAWGWERVRREVQRVKAEGRDYNLPELVPQPSPSTDGNTVKHNQ